MALSQKGSTFLLRQQRALRMKRVSTAISTDPSHYFKEGLIKRPCAFYSMFPCTFEASTSTIYYDVNEAVNHGNIFDRVVTCPCPPLSASIFGINRCNRVQVREEKGQDDRRQ